MLLTVTTDWLQIYIAIGQLILSVVGFLLLYSTLVVQAKVATSQQNMIEIEGRRARREIRPVFQVYQEYSCEWLDFTKFGFTCMQNDAYDLHVVSKSGQFVEAHEAKTKLPFVAAGYTLAFSYRFTQPLPYPEKNVADFLIVVELTYTDVDGFPYKQILSGPHCDISEGRPIPTW
jgi:hypothetical protein